MSNDKRGEIPMTTMIACGQHEVRLPLSPAQEHLASPEERFQIALTMLDAIQESAQDLPYAELRKRVMRHTGLGWAAAALAIQHRQARPKPHAD